MRIGVIIPDRGDRPQLLNHCRYLISQQTIFPNDIFFVDYAPESYSKDISQRYRRGYDYMRGRNLDAILFMESDDWYSPTYISVMLAAWVKAGKPDIFGTDYTYYYNIRKWAWHPMLHDTRSSAMSTLIKPDMNFDWPPDHEPYTDTHLWVVARHIETGKLLTNATFHPDPVICLGIKHGIGLTGGNGHTTHMHRYINQDFNKEWLRKIIDPLSFEFYKNLLP